MQIVMLAILAVFALVHSGLAGLRASGEKLVGERAYRVFFAGISLPLAVSAVVRFGSSHPRPSRFVLLTKPTSLVQCT